MKQFKMTLAGTKAMEKIIALGPERVLQIIDAHDELQAFVNDVASESCYQLPGEFPDDGEDGQIPCRSCQARDLLAAIPRTR